MESLVPLWRLLVLVLISAIGGGALDPPNIVDPDPRIPTFKNVGETLLLICHGQLPLVWKFPSASEVYKTEDRVNITHAKLDEGNSTGPLYTSTLTLRNLNHNDVGFFFCEYDPQELQRDKDEEVDLKSKIYVYVNDERNPLVPHDLGFALNAITGRSITIPCRPTSPTVQITFMKDAQVVNLDSNKYDMQKGYTVDPVVLSSTGLYICQGKIGDFMQEIHWYLTVHAGNDGEYALRPPSVSVKDNGYITVGTEFFLNCETEQDTYVTYNVNWTDPAGVINSGRSRVESGWVDAKKKAFFSKLIVKNAQKEDAGSYVCTVTTRARQKTSSVVVKVLEAADRFLEVKTVREDIEVKLNNTATWAIQISSYPHGQDILWKNAAGNEIIPDHRFKIEKKKSETVLKILQVRLKDAGSYQLIVNVPEYKELHKVLNLTLTVIAKPEIEMKGKFSEYFQTGRNHTLECRALGYPYPNIQWYFLATDSFDEEPIGSCEIKNMTPIKDQEILLPRERYSVNISRVNFLPEKSGIYRCKAWNNEGTACYTRIVRVVDFPGERGFGINSPTEFIDQDIVNLTCALSKLNRTKTLLGWRIKGAAGELSPLNDKKGSLITQEDAESAWSQQKILSFAKINKDDSGEYICLVGVAGETENEQLSKIVQVRDMEPPKIIRTNLNKTEITLKEGEPPELNLFCQASGLPKPTIEWTKDGVPQADWPSEIKYNVTQNGETLLFPYIREVASGKYACVARNRNGTDDSYLSIEVEGNTGFNLWLIGLLILAFIVVMILLVCLAKRRHQEKEMKNWLRDLQVAEFETGAVENINPDLGIEDQVNLLPYDKKWEFPKKNLKIGMQLGSGAFGRVMKAEAQGIIKEGDMTIVAVKMVKANADESHIKALMSELKIMVHLGKHINVVNLLGACTEHLVKKKELLVIVEYCQFGSLLSYVHRHRHSFINQLDAERGIVDPNICTYQSRRRFSSGASQGPKKPASNGYRTLEELNEVATPASSPTTYEPVVGGINCNGFVGNNCHNPQYAMQIHPVGTSARVGADKDRSSTYNDSRLEYYGQGSTVGSMCTDMSFVSNSPTVLGTDGKRRSSGGSSCNDHYRGDYQHLNIEPIKTTDLLCWGFQIARGMEYLAQRKVLHGDLAARNVLLSENNVVKICDFGLAKEMYKDYKYKKKSEGVLLPVKWMAVESIMYAVFSTQSDVWSFGVVLWELFTLGKTPYPGMEADDRFYKQLSEGYRMEKPPLAPSSMYDLMIECWAQQPSDRPSFSSLADRIGDLMDEGLRQYYVDLNVTNERMNREWLAGDGDLLSKMSRPDFGSGNCRTSPERERQYENVPQAETLTDGGYLLPKSPGDCLPNFTLVSFPGPSTNYQNFNSHAGSTFHGQNIPTSQLYACNNSYLLMNNSTNGNTQTSPTSGGTITFSQPVKNGSTSGMISTVHFKNTIPQLAENPRENVSRSPPKKMSTEVPYSMDYDDKGKNGCGQGPSGGNYIPNNLILPNGQVRDLDEIVREVECERQRMQPVSGNDSDKTEINPSLTRKGGESPDLKYAIRRHKNDSGIGSIDSSQFESCNSGGACYKEGETSNTLKVSKFEEGSLSYHENLGYVSSPPLFNMQDGERQNANFLQIH